MRMPAWPDSGENPPPDCRLTTYCILTWHRAERGSKRPPDSCKGPKAIQEGLIHTVAFQRLYLLIPARLGAGRAGFQHTNLGRGWAGGKQTVSIAQHCGFLLRAAFSGERSSTCRPETLYGEGSGCTGTLQ